MEGQTCPSAGCDATLHCHEQTCVECTDASHCATGVACVNNVCTIAPADASCSTVCSADSKGGKRSTCSTTCTCPTGYNDAPDSECSFNAPTCPVCAPTTCSVVTPAKQNPGTEDECCPQCVDLEPIEEGWTEAQLLLNIQPQDCEGTWSACTSQCERACERVFTMTQAQAGTGTSCPKAQDCHFGDDGCSGQIAQKTGRRLLQNQLEAPVELLVDCTGVTCPAVVGCDLPTHYVKNGVCCPECVPVDNCYEGTIEPLAVARCGMNFDDADGQCGFACPERKDEDCPEDLTCHTDLTPCDDISTGTGGSTTSSAERGRRLLDFECSGGPEEIIDCPDFTHAELQDAFTFISDNFVEILDITDELLPEPADPFSSSKLQRYKKKFCDLKIKCISNEPKCDGTLLGMSHGILSNKLFLCYDTIADSSYCNLVETIAHEAGHALSMGDGVAFHVAGGNPGDRIYALGDSAGSLCWTSGLDHTIADTIVPTLDDGEVCGNAGECFSGYCKCKCYTPWASTDPGDECWGDDWCYGMGAPYGEAKCSGINAWCGTQGECMCNDDGHCAATEYCAYGFLGIGINECQPKKSNGQTCLNDRKCISDRCFWGFCKACSNDNHCNDNDQCTNGVCE